MSRPVPRIVGYGVDSLELFSRAPLDPAQLDVLRARRAAALQGRSAEVDYAGELFQVAPRRGRHGALLLRGDNMAIALRPDARGLRPCIVVDLRAVFLADVGPDVAAEAARAVIEQLTVPSPASRPMLVSRIDLAADVQGWALRPAHLARFHTRGKRVREWDGTRTFTGFTFGKRPRLARIYDKTAEIAVSGKSWVVDAWSRSGRYRPGAPVWRVEFQLRREALRTRARARDGMPLDTWEEVRSAIGTLWCELTSDWLSIRLPRTGRTRRRYAREWQPIMAEPFQGTAWAGAREPLRPVVARTQPRSNDAT
jgi:hypothetical protein